MFSSATNLLMTSLIRLSLAAALAAFGAGSAFARIERVVEKTFTADAAGTLRVETDGGSIRVDPASGSVVTIKAIQRIRANSETEADDLLTKLDLIMEQNGNDVRVAAKYERPPLGFRWGSWPPVHVDFVIGVPAAFATDLHTSGGSITIGDLGGRADARTSGGSIKLGRMGSSVDARTSGGSITLAEAGGAVELRTSGGNITAGRIDGSAELSTSGGGIKVESVSGILRAHTSGGNIQAGFTGPLQEDSSLSTSGGSVHVTVEPSLAFRLDASSSGGGVRADGLTIRLADSGARRDRLVGDVNGGGPTLKLRSSGGGVAVYVR